MIDFIENYYVDKSSLTDDGYDIQKAKNKAVSVVLPLIIKNELTPKQGLCLKYYYVNKKSQSEIAEILKLSQPTVSRHINTAKDIVNSNLKYCYIALSKGIQEYDRLSGEVNIV